MSEVRPGYKQTEVGVIPEDWEAPSLGELFAFKNGLNKAKTYFGYGTPIINYMDVYKKPGLFCQDIYGRVSVNRAELDSYAVKKGDVFFTRTSETVEEVGIASVMLDELPDAVFSGFILRARSKDLRIVDQYKKYCFSSIMVRKQIIAKSTYTTRALTNGRVLSLVALPLPPILAEQTAIAEVLSDTDALIHGLDQLITKKRNIKQAAMQELLTGKRRLPGFAGEWEEKKVSEVGEIITGSTPPTSEKKYWNGNIPWITPTDISAIRDIWCSERQITQSGLKVIRQLPANTLLVTCIASIGKNSILRKTGACNQQINAVIPDDKNNVDYLYYLIENNKFHLLSRAGITATNIVSKREFMEIVFVFPPTLVEQTAIAAVLSDMDAEIAALEQKRDKYKAIKRGMMQELLNGKTRLV